MNENNRIIISISDEEISTMFGRGGMKKLFDLQYNPIIIINRNVIVDMCDNIKNGNLICLINYDCYGNLSHEIIDIDINEKWKRDDLESYRRNVRLRSDDPSSVTEMNVESFLLNCKRWQDVSEHPTSCATGDVVPKTMDASMASVVGILTDVC